MGAPASFNVQEFAADPTGATKSTEALQAAIEAAAESGGGTVEVPPGRYVIGTITLRSNISIHIHAGANLVGSPDIDDYPEQNEGHIPPEFPYVRCLFVGFDLHDVEITGGGTVDGAGAAFMDYSVPMFDETFTRNVLESMPENRRHEYVSEHKRMRPTWIFFLRRCRDVRFTGFRVVDAARWTTRFSRCENVYLSGLLINNDLRAANCDGMHFTGCRNIVVSDCTIVSGDDCIAVTTYGEAGASSSGTVITNCVLTSHSAGIRIGLGEGAVLENVAISNCVLRNCNRGVGIFAGTGATVRDITVSNLQVSTRLIAGIWWGKAEPVMITTIGKDAAIENVAVTGVSARSEQGIVINAVPESTVRDIRLSDVRLRLASGPMSPHTGGTLDLRPYSMERRRLPALYVHGVFRLCLHNVDISVDGNSEGTRPDAIEIHECHEMEIAGLREHSY